MLTFARASLAALLMLSMAGASAFAADPPPLKIGMITTLSTAGGYLGEDMRDGFQLAIDEEHGKLGGVPVQVLVEDDGLKPANGKQIADKFLQQDKIQLFTGIIYSNVALAVVPSVVEAGAFYVSPNSGPSQLAGKGCNKNFFVVSWQNDTPHEATGQYAQYLGIKKMVVVAPNYTTGRDAITGFKRTYHGQIAEEIYTALDQTDYSAELARIRAANADGIYYFLPGGLGINFLKQFTQAGLKKSMKVVLPEFSLENHVDRRGRQRRRGPVRHGALARRPAVRGQQEVRRGLPRQVPPRAHAVREPGLRYREADRERAARGERRPLEGRRVSRGAAQGGLQIDARRVQVRPQPVSRARLVQHESRPRSEDAKAAHPRRRQDHARHRRRLFGPVQADVSTAAHPSTSSG